MKSLLDPTFRYVPATQTDIRKTFARIRREQRQEQEKRRTEALYDIPYAEPVEITRPKFADRVSSVVPYEELAAKIDRAKRMK